MRSFLWKSRPSTIFFGRCVLVAVLLVLALPTIAASPDTISYSVVAVPAVGGTVNLGDSLGTNDLTITVRTIDDNDGEAPAITDGSVTVEEVPTAVTLKKVSAAPILNATTGSVLLGLLVVAIFTAVYIIWRKLQSGSKDL